jgi:WD40 repeat protein
MSGGGKSSTSANIACAALALSLFACVTPASPQKREARMRTYRLQVPNTMYTEAVAFTPDDSALAIVQWRNLGKNPYKSVFDLLLWDFRTGKELVRRPFHFATDFGSDHYVWPKALRYFDGGKWLAYCGGDRIRLFETTGYKQAAEIAVGRSMPGTGKRLGIDHCAFSADGREVVVESREFYGPPVISLDEDSPVLIRVFKLPSGRQTGQWQFPTNGLVTGLALSPNGREIAWTTAGDEGAWLWNHVPRSAKNLHILDIQTGKLLSVHSDRTEGELEFASGNRLLSVSEGPAFRRNDGEGIRIWDPRTGKQLGEIKSRPSGVHQRLQVSQNLGVILGYTGTDKAQENFVNIDTISFRLWDAFSGRILFTSPVTRYSLLRGYSSPPPPRFILSTDGRLVARWGPDWPDVSVYELAGGAASAPANSNVRTEAEKPREGNSRKWYHRPR